MDYSKPWYWLNDNSRAFLARGYLGEGQTAEERVRQIADRAEELLKKPGFSDKLYEYVSKGWVSFSSPVWANFGVNKGLPISCFGSYVDDNMGSILYSHAEIGMMTKYGGGTSAYFGALRGRGKEITGNGYSSGSVHFMQLFDKLIDVVSQGSVRRGTFAAYLPIEHPDVLEFLDLNTEGNPIQGINYAITVTNQWLEEMKDGDEEKRTIWAKVLQRRGEIGYPYIMFIDNANDQRPEVYKEKDLQIYASNVCSEIMLPSKDDWSFVCCLSSINLLFYDDWRDTDLVETMTYLLDAVMEEFILKLEELRDHEDPEKRRAFVFMERAYKFAKENRALGLGVLGYHSLLQSKKLSFESEEAAKLNEETFKFVRDKAYAASAEMAKEYGEPEVLKGYGRRNTTLMAIAPTTSSAFILGQVSQGIEPVWSNCYVKDAAKLKVTIKNPFLIDPLQEKGKDEKEVWNSIRDNDGSVQHLDFLSDEEKEIFRTFAEIDQKVIIDQAATRQQYIDQGQSLNIMVPPNVPPREINELYLTAWKKGIKALYYQHSMNAAQALTRQKLTRKD